MWHISGAAIAAWRQPVAGVTPPKSVAALPVSLKGGVRVWEGC